MSYEKELAAAKKAVTLAARLSQVTSYWARVRAWSLYESLKLKQTLLCNESGSAEDSFAIPSLEKIR